MKGIFLAFLAIGIILLSLSIYVPPPTHNERVAILLRTHPDNWHLAFNTADGRLLGFDTDISKTQLLSYLRDTADRYPVSRSLASLVSAFVILFSIFGLARSSKLKRQPTDG
jgi:hypothetical protein